MRVRRIEVFFFVMTMSFIAFMFYEIDSSQRDHKEALSCLLKIQEKVSFFGETEATLTSQMALMSERLKAFLI